MEDPSARKEFGQCYSSVLHGAQTNLHDGGAPE